MSVFVRPTLGRALWMTPLGAALALIGTILVRQTLDMTPIWDQEVVLVLMWIGSFLGFLIGIGGFDYWSRWMIGSPTRPEDHSQHGATSWRSYFAFNTDHKVIGLQYIGTTLIFFLIGGLFAEVFRAQLARPNSNVVDPETYNSLMSQHAVLMIFLFIIPIFAGIGNYVIPLMLGAADMAFPRLNAVSFWMLPFAGLTFLASFLFGSFDTGWTAYPPLATLAPLGQSLFSVGVQFAGASSIATAVNFIVTIITMRAPGMTFFRMPLLVWANFTTSMLVTFATPFIAGAQFMSLFDRVMGTHFFEPDAGGATLAYQHIFWFYSHPAVYIMILPGFGIISEVIATNSRKPIFGYRAIAFSTVGIAVLGYSVWAHHMFVSGMHSWLRVPMMISTALIAVPTGIKIFSWLGTLYRGVLQMNTAMLFALGFIWTFVIGGISGVMIASVPFDVSVSNTYFIVAHFHYVLYGGSVMTIWPASTSGTRRSPAGSWTSGWGSCTSGARSSASTAPSCQCTGSASRGCRGACRPTRPSSSSGTR